MSEQQAPKNKPIIARFKSHPFFIKVQWSNENQGWEVIDHRTGKVFPECDIFDWVGVRND